jgi:hypothetical protein
MSEGLLITCWVCLRGETLVGTIRWLSCSEHIIRPRRIDELNIIVVVVV